MDKKVTPQEFLNAAKGESLLQKEMTQEAKRYIRSNYPLSWRNYSELRKVVRKNHLHSLTRKAQAERDEFVEVE